MDADQATRSLAELGLHAQGGREARITGLSVDSRSARTGHLFAALPGSHVHGGEFIGYALRMGAAAILTDRAGAALMIMDHHRRFVDFVGALSREYPALFRTAGAP